MTHIHASNHANKKCIIRDMKENLGCFRVLKTLPKVRGPLDQTIYVQTQTGHLRMRNLHQRGPLDQEIYV